MWHRQGYGECECRCPEATRTIMTSTPLRNFLAASLRKPRLPYERCRRHPPRRSSISVLAAWENLARSKPGLSTFSG